MATLLSYALTTVADVRAIPGMDSSISDDYIIRKINQATEMIEGYCGRRFKATDYTEYYDGSGIDELLLRNFPVNSVTSIGGRDTSLNEDDFNTVDANQYFTDLDAGTIEAVSSFYGGWDRWKVVYNAGYTTIPADLAEACATLAAYLVNNDASSTAGVTQKKEGTREIHYGDTKVQYGSDPASANNIITQLGLQVTLDRYAEIVISGQR